VIKHGYDLERILKDPNLGKTQVVKMARDAHAEWLRMGELFIVMSLAFSAENLPLTRSCLVEVKHWLKSTLSSTRLLEVTLDAIDKKRVANERAQARVDETLSWINEEGEFE